MRDAGPDAAREHGSTGARAHPTPPDERLPLSLKLIFGFPSFAGAAIAIPIFVYLPKFYADEVLVPLGWLAVGIALARAMDAITDPLMGFISDHTHTRWGRRKPWIAIGVPLSAIALVALFSPPESLSGIRAAGWFGAAFLLYFLFSTVYEIPHYGLGAELTLDYHERTSLFGVRSIFIIPGTLTAILVPELLAQIGVVDQRRALFGVAVMFATLLLISYGLLLARVRERPEFMSRPSNPLVPGVRRAMRNRPFRILLFTYVISSIPGAIPPTLMPFYTEYVIQVDDPERWLSIFLGTYFLSGFLFLALWIPLARRFGKLPVWLANFAIGISGGSMLFFTGPGDELKVALLLFYTGSQFGAGFFLAPAMQADVIDYDELHTGKRREAQYGSFWAIATKLVVIPSASIPLAVLGLMAYVPNQAQTAEVVYAIRVIFALAPAFFSTLAFFVARRYPISERAHRAILDGIQQHARGESAVDPLTDRAVAPPRERSVDQDTAWFLDYFTRSELAEVERGDVASVLSSVLRKSGLWLCLMLLASGAAGWMVVRAGSGEISAVEQTAIALLVVTGALTLAGSLFQVLRIKPALRMLRAPAPPEDIAQHLSDVAAYWDAAAPLPGEAAPSDA